MDSFSIDFLDFSHWPAAKSNLVCSHAGVTDNFAGQRVTGASKNACQCFGPQFANDPLLGKLSCGSDFLSYQNTAFMSDLEQVRRRLTALNARALIFNKLFLNDATCKDLWLWTVNLAQQPWTQILEENNYFLILKM